MTDRWLVGRQNTFTSWAVASGHSQWWSGWVEDSRYYGGRSERREERGESMYDMIMVRDIGCNVYTAHVTDRARLADIS